MMINVAIDGPAGAGKSTIAKAAAKALGYIYVDTGALYRTVALGAVRAGVLKSDDGIAALLPNLQVELKFVDGSQHVYLNGEDVSDLIATVVLPNAQVKIFLSATPECRARRRYKELVEKGQTVTYEDVLADVNRRDYQDSHREIAPLKPSADSIMADTSEMDLQQSTDLIINIIREHTK